MAQKNATLRAQIGGSTYDLMPKGSVYNIYVDDITTLAQKLQQIVTALNGKVTPEQLEQTLAGFAGGGSGGSLLDGNGIIKQEYLPDDIGNCAVKPFPPAVQSASFENDGVIVVTELENNTFYYLDVSDSEFNQYNHFFGFSNGTTIAGALNVQKRCIYFHERGEPNASGKVYGHVYGNNCSYEYSIDAQGNVTGSGYGNSEYLCTNNFNNAYTPTHDYHPATKKYVDDTALKVANEAVANIVFPDVEKGNWNQNDPEAADYIKNRTHYVEYSDNLVEILPTTSLVVNEEMGAFMLQDAIELTAGQQYVVKFTDSSNNEVEYTTMCVEAPENEDGMKWMLGDAGLMEGTPTTGEPFIMVVLDPSVVPQIGFGAMVMWIGGTMLQTISISAQEEIVHKIDPKYLPDFVVKATWNDDWSSLTYDKTYEEITEAVTAGKNVYMLCDGVRYGLCSTGDYYEFMNLYTYDGLYHEAYGIRSNGETYYRSFKISAETTFEFDSATAGEAPPT